MGSAGLARGAAKKALLHLTNPNFPFFRCFTHLRQFPFSVLSSFLSHKSAMAATMRRSTKKIDLVPSISKGERNVYVRQTYLIICRTLFDIFFPPLGLLRGPASPPQLWWDNTILCLFVLFLLQPPFIKQGKIRK